MIYISADGLSKSFGDKELFANLTFGIEKGRKLALVGRNGCGKSTLLRVIAGAEPPDGGTVSTRRGLRTAYLEQAPYFDPAHSVREALFAGGGPELAAIAEYEALADSEAPDPDRMQQLMERITDANAWDYESRVREVMGKLGIAGLSQPVGKLSGGQRRRLALARALVSEPDILLLDEPTNHLDTDTIEWLENRLSGSSVTLLLVTHDRYFLDRICDGIIEIDRGEAFFYDGDYEDFLEQKAEREVNRDRAADRAANLFRKELEWLRRQPKARTTKSKARIDRAGDLEKASKRELREGRVQMEFGSARLGSKILELEGVNLSLGGKKLIADFEYTFRKGERIGIAGPNGVGKTSFLNLITGRLAPDSGRIETGETVQYGYFTQGGLKIKPGQKVIDVIRDAAETVEMGKGQTLDAAQALTLFGFPPPRQHTQAELLSGGEKRRLYLLRVLMEQPNFLILDEPTNDLDLITLNTLEAFLESFPGCLIIVSHDRYFLDKLTDHLFIFEGEGRIKPFPGNYSQYRRYKADQDALAQEAAKEAEKRAQPARERSREKTKLSYNEQKEFDALEQRMPEIETRISELEEKMNSGETDYMKLEEWGAELEALRAELSAAEDRWLELSEFV